MKKTIWIALAFALLNTSCVQSERAVSPEEIGKIFVTIDDKLDDIRTATKNAPEQLDEILSQLDGLVSKHPNIAPFHLLMGRAFILRDCSFRNLDCNKNATIHLQKSAQLDPKAVRVHVLLAQNAINAGCLQCAQPYISAAQAIEVNNPYVLEIRARFAQFSGNHVEAERLYLQAVNLFPNAKKRWQTYNGLSQIYKEREDFERAEWAAKNLVNASPEGAWSNGNLGNFYIYALGDYENAIPILRKALSIMNYRSAREALDLAMYERWADAVIKKSDEGIVKGLWDEAQASTKDTRKMFMESANYAGSGRAARVLLEKNLVPPDVIGQQWEQGRTPVLMAVRNDNTDLAVFLIDQGADVNARDPSGMTVIQMASVYGNVKILDAASRKNANFSELMPERAETALMLVAQSGKSRPDRIKAAEFLIGKGVSINVKSAREWTALCYAISVQDIEMVRYLLSRGAKTEGEWSKGGMESPVALAIRGGDAEIFQELLKNKQDRTYKIAGMSLGEFAKQNGRVEMEEMLRALK